MPKRIGVFVDISNLFYCLKKKFQNRKLDYKAFLEYIRPYGDIQQAIAYGSQMTDEAESFIALLKQLGFQTKYKVPKQFQNGDKIKYKSDWDVGIVIDIIRMQDRFDMIVLGSADGDMAPLVTYLREKGIDVLILACNISKDLKESATKIVEIPQSFLEQSKKSIVKQKSIAEVVFKREYVNEADAK